MALLFLFGVFSNAKASLLSSLNSMVLKTSTGSLGRSFNSQTVPLLESESNILPNAQLSSMNDLTVVDNSALLPETGPLGTSANIDTATDNDHISVYVVHKGDTLADIAKMFNVSSNTIVWANDLKRGQALTDGQVLVILPITGVRHIVKAGDTISSIAKKYKGDAEEIAQFNNLEVNSALKVGDEVIVPNGEVVTSPTKPNSTGKEVRIPSPNAPVYEGYYLRPIQGGLKTQGIHGHNAVDLANKLGSNVYASAAGTVIVARTGGWNGGYGNYVVIRHPNNTQTLYAHLQNLIVSLGQSVSQGEVIGHLGQSGNATGPHVHFEIRGAANPF